MQSTVHFLWCFVLVAFVAIAPSIAMYLYLKDGKEITSRYVERGSTPPPIQKNKCPQKGSRAGSTPPQIYQIKSIQVLFVSIIHPSKPRTIVVAALRNFAYPREED